MPSQKLGLFLSCDRVKRRPTRRSGYPRHAAVRFAAAFLVTIRASRTDTQVGGTSFVLAAGYTFSETKIFGPPTIYWRVVEHSHNFLFVV